MKRQLQFAALLLGLSPVASLAQGIINGGFEQYDQANKFLPGWHIYIKSLDVGVIQRDYGTNMNGVSGSSINYQYFQSGQPYISVNHPTGDNAGGLMLGKYCLWGAGFMNLGTIFIEQTLVVPLNAQSIQMRAYGPQGLYLNEQFVRPSLKTTISGSLAEWCIDISHLAGQEVTLALTIYSGGGFDDVRFSSEPVPEPSVIGLGILGMEALVAAANRKRVI